MNNLLVDSDEAIGTLIHIAVKVFGHPLCFLARGFLTGFSSKHLPFRDDTNANVQTVGLASNCLVTNGVDVGRHHRVPSLRHGGMSGSRRIGTSARRTHG